MSETLNDKTALPPGDVSDGTTELLWVQKTTGTAPADRKFSLSAMLTWLRTRLAMVSPTEGGLIRNNTVAGAGETHFVSGVGSDGLLLYSVPEGSGNVAGDTSSVVGNVVSFADTTGKTIQDSGIATTELLEKSNNLSDLDDAAARSNLGAAGLEDDNEFTGNNTFTGQLNIYNPQGFFKTDSEQPAFKKTGNYEVQTSQLIRVVIDDTIVEIAENTAIAMGSTPSVGTDMAIWIKTDGILEASENFTSITDGVRTLGGFHYAPNGNATLDPGGNWANHAGGPDPAVPQINEYSIWDLKWRPSVDDPRGLALVPVLNEWWGMYPMNNGNVAGRPIHSYGVNPCRDGNPPRKRWADGTAYSDATPMNIFELLASEGFRPPQPWNFQFAALGTTEEASAGGSDPGNTGEQDTGQDKNRFISAWGLFDITGVIRAWSSDLWLDTTDTAGVTQGRSNGIFRIQRFAGLGGYWFIGSDSGSRYVDTFNSSASGTSLGGRGVCDHLILV